MANISDEDAVITLHVKLVSDVEGLDGSGGNPDPFLSGIDSLDIQQYIDQEVLTSTNELIADAMESVGVDLDALQDATSLVKDIGKNGLGNIGSFAKGPVGFMESKFVELIGRAGPYGALAAAVIAIVIASPEIFKAVVEMLAVKGGPLNQDFRFSMEEQLNQQYDRRTQYRRLVGDDPVITVNTLGFVTPSDPDFDGNSLISAPISRSGRVGLRDESYGHIHGI